MGVPLQFAFTADVPDAIRKRGDGSLELRGAIGRSGLVQAYPVLFMPPSAEVVAR